MAFVGGTRIAVLIGDSRVAIIDRRTGERDPLGDLGFGPVLVLVRQGGVRIGVGPRLLVEPVVESSAGLVGSFVVNHVLCTLPEADS